MFSACPFPETRYSMTLTITLPPELEQKLREQAARGGQDLNAFILQAILEKIARRDGDTQEMLAQQEAERLASQVGWERLVKSRRPPQEWFDADDNPFEPEATSGPLS
jgi:hypothetical protein